MKTIILYFLLLFTTLGFSQNELPETLIERTLLLEIGPSTGTGFIIVDSLKRVVLVTAKHVFIDENSKKFYSQVVKVTWYPHNAEKDEPNSLIIDLQALSTQKCVLFNENVDVIAIIIGAFIQKDNTSFINYFPAVKKLGKMSMLMVFDISNINLFENCRIGNDIFVFGYPRSLGLKNIPQYDFNRPLLRKGCIAGKSNTLKNIIIDAPTYGGNSGGPVIELVGNILKYEFKLTGVVSAFILLEEIWLNPNYGIKNIEISNSGYSVVIPINEVLSLLK